MTRPGGWGASSGADEGPKPRRGPPGRGLSWPALSRTLAEEPRVPDQLLEGRMIRFELPTDEVEYLQLAFPAAGPGLVASWGTQISPFTVATWDGPDMPPRWQLTDRPLNLSPDGEWVSVYDKGAGEVRITWVGAKGPTAVVDRDKGADNVWTAVAGGDGERTDLG